MSTVRPLRPPPPEPLELHARAMDNLRYIRETMERAGSFTALSGWSQVLIGVTAIVAAWFTSRQTDSTAWVAVWTVEALCAVAIGGLGTALKAQRAGVPLLSGPGRKFVLGLAPALLTGGILTVVLFRTGAPGLLPGVWLLLFGVGLLGAGAFSVRIVPLMGLCFMTVGTLAVFTPAHWGDAWMAVGFGGLNLVFGALIARRYGG